MNAAEASNDTGSGVVKVSIEDYGSAQQRTATLNVAGKPVVAATPVQSR